MIKIFRALGKILNVMYVPIEFLKLEILEYEFTITEQCLTYEIVSVREIFQRVNISANTEICIEFLKRYTQILAIQISVKHATIYLILVCNRFQLIDWLVFSC